MNEFNLKSKELTPDIINRFKTALSIGKWPDGRVLTEDQKEILIQAIIIYDNKNTPAGQRIGELEDADCSVSDVSKKEDLNLSKIETKKIKWH